MVCYARRATGMLTIVLVTIALYGAGTAHFLNTAALLTSLAIVFGCAIVLACAGLVALRAVQHKRARAGACVRCRHRCQHAMTGPPQRLWLMSRAQRSLPVVPTARVYLPIPQVPAQRVPAQRAQAQRAQAQRAQAQRVPAVGVLAVGVPADEGMGPHWPDRPLRGHLLAEPAGPGQHQPQRARAAAASR
jgi:hypothetical protein